VENLLHQSLRGLAALLLSALPLPRTGADMERQMQCPHVGDTLESGNSSDIYTTRKISCFSFHTPPNNVLSALNGNGVPSVTAIGNALTGLPLSPASIRAYPFGPATSPPDPDDCSQGSLDPDNYDDQNDDSLQRGQAPATSIDFERVCALHLPPSDAPRFCPYAGMARESTMYRPYGRCTATTTKGCEQLWLGVSASPRN
jgi:hypothetical protein